MPTVAGANWACHFRQSPWRHSRKVSVRRWTSDLRPVFRLTRLIGSARFRGIGKGHRFRCSDPTESMTAPRQ